MKEESNDKRKLMKKWDCKINIIPAYTKRKVIFYTRV